MMVWFSGSGVARVNKVALRHARLGWATILGYAVKNFYLTSRIGRLSLPSFCEWVVVHVNWWLIKLCLCSHSLFPSAPVDNIWATMIVWRIRGKIIRTVLCCVVYNNCAQWYAHTHTWVFLKVDRWFRFRFAFLYVFCRFVCVLFAF